MSNADPDEDLVENPEPEADSTAEADDQPEPESESNLIAGTNNSGNSDTGNASSEPPLGCADIEQSVEQNNEGGAQGPHQNAEDGVNDNDLADVAQAETELDFAAEDEQYYQKNNSEVSFVGAEWSLEPEENSQDYHQNSAEGDAEEGANINYGTESDQFVSLPSDRTESSCQLASNGRVDDGINLRDANAQNDGPENGASGDCDNIGNNEHEPEGNANCMNIMAEEDKDLDETKEFETAEEDQELPTDQVFNSDHHPEEDAVGSDGSGERVVSPENGQVLSNTGVEDSELTSAAGSVGEQVQSLVENVGNSDADADVAEALVVEKGVPEDEISALSSGEARVEDIAAENYQPECDQSAMENNHGESSPSCNENCSNNHSNRVYCGQTADVENMSVLESSCDSNVHPGVIGHKRIGVNDVEMEDGILKNEGKEGISNKTDRKLPNGTETVRVDQEKDRNTNKCDNNESNGLNIDHSSLSLTKDKGAIPKYKNNFSSHSSTKSSSSPDTSSSNESLHNLKDIGASRNSDMEHDDNLEDELLSELDATLKTSKELGSNESEHSQESIHVEDGTSKSCDQCLKNNEQCSFNHNSTKGRHFDIPEVKELKRQLRQAKQLLLDRECAISSLKEDVEDQRSRSESLLLERESHQKEIECLKYQNTEDLYIPQIKELEYTINQQQNEVRGLKDKLSSHDSAAKRAISTLQHEMKLRIDQVTKQYEDVTKEKDSMVVKYAQAEHKNLECLKQAERAENKLHDMEKERDAFLLRMRSVKEQRTKLAAEVEAKNSEIHGLNKELDKHREMISSADVRIKWAQNKLKVELDTHKETKNQLEKMTARLKEAKEETQQIRQDCQAIIKTYQESEEVKSNSLDKELKQKETELLVNEQQKTNFELAHVRTQRELEQVKGDLEESKSKYSAVSERMSVLDGEVQLKQANMNKFAEIIQRQKKEIQELRERIETLVQYRTDFNRSQDLIKSLDSEISELKISNKDLVSDMEACRKREVDKLELTEKLSQKNADLQSDNTNMSNKVLDLTGELQSLKMEFQCTDTKLRDISSDLAAEKKLHREEVQSLNTKFAGKCKAVEDLMRKLDEEKDEIKTLKRKHANNVKDLTRQLQQVRRKLEGYEATSNSTNGDKDTTSMGSRTSSNGSLNTVNIADQTNTQIVQPGSHTNSTTKPNPSPEQEYPVITEQVEVDKQVLIERIVKLQRAHARKNEKLEFMDDHISQLVDEIQKKNRIIQSYVLKEESGALTSDSGDRMKPVEENVMQAEMSRKHSIMGSVYSSHPTDGTMTLDLSLEINRKLQAVLEDTLLKNMTLKESLDTLGKEIARLSQENRSLQLQIQGKARSKGHTARR